MNTVRRGQSSRNPGSSDWRKSSFSSDSSSCVEVVGTLTAIRDSKNIGGPVLAFDNDDPAALFVAWSKTAR